MPDVVPPESDTEKLLAELGALVEGGLGGVQPFGGSHWFKVVAGTRLAHRADGFRRLRALHIIGINIVVSTSTTWSQWNGVPSGGDATILSYRPNDANNISDVIYLNVPLPFDVDPNLTLFIDNGGTQICNVGVYWDFA